MKKLAASIFLLAFSPQVALAGGDVMSEMRTKLKFLNNRQSVISDNIANANTPKFKASDLKPIDYGKAGGSPSTIQLATTSPGHLGAGKSNIHFKKIRQKDSYDTAPNGNNVVLEEQMVKMSDTDMQYKETASVMKQMNGLMRLAIGGAR